MSCEYSEVQSGGCDPKSDPDSQESFDSITFDFSDDEKPLSTKYKSSKRKTKRLKAVDRTYGLRPRNHLRRPSYDFDVDDKDKDPSFSRKDSRHRIRSPIGTKCRRLTANARERQRMKEINDAFSTLRGVLPPFHSRPSTRVSMTKIRTLKLASSYIQALSDLLSGTDSISSELNAYSENLQKHFEDIQKSSESSQESDSSIAHDTKSSDGLSHSMKSVNWNEISASDDELFNLLENEMLSIKAQQNNNNNDSSQDLNWNDEMVQLGCN